MQLTSALTLFFLLTVSAWAGTFIETFDGKELEDWQVLVQKARHGFLIPITPFFCL